jgi:hypothetical protein
MAHFALIKNGIVQRVHVLNNAVITDENGVEQESLGQQFLGDLHGRNPADFVQCSYNGNMRGLYPGVGYRYDADLDEFVAPVVEPAETD